MKHLGLLLEASNVVDNYQHMKHFHALSQDSLLW